MQQQPARRSSGWKILLWVFIVLVLGLSVLLNMVLLGTVGARLEAKGVLARQTIEHGANDETIAVYNVSGVIDGQAVSQFSQFYKAIVGDPDVKAVVLRVNSPGGGVTASDQIHNMVKKIRNNGKVVVVSMGALAASGGYYISAPADEIIAEKTTITGSIGVITGWFVFKGTLDKIGAEAMTVKSSNADVWKDAMSATASPQEYQINHIRDILDEMQTRFEDVVKKGRVDRKRNNKSKLHLKTENVQVADKNGRTVTRQTIEPFNGKVYLAKKAKTLGLIDDIGYETDAIERAKALASLSKANVVRFVRRRTFMESIFDGKTNSAPLTIDRNLLDQLQTPKFMMLWKAE